MAIETFNSPDGRFRLVVIRGDDDITIGFDGYSWHTHGDILAEVHNHLHGTEYSPEEAAAFLVDEVLESKRPFHILSRDGIVQNVWAKDDMADGDPQAKEGESIESRYWDNTKIR